MKTYLLVLLQCALVINTIGQNISSYISQTNLDSLVRTVRDLSGEDSIYLSGIKTRIVHRVSASGNDLAAAYINQRLSNYNLNVVEQNYSLGGRNIIATQTGSLYPDSSYIICAHYDAVTSYCADDDASGVAAIIEAARILSGHCFDYTIIYALWDEEEIGLKGSKFYAQEASNSNQSILGVINLEMLGYDSNDDRKFDIHINNFPSSVLLKDSMLSMVSTHQLSLVPNIINPGTPASDHSSFWNQNYGAIVFGESFFGGDGNPAYHTPNDRINLFNLTYFKELAKLSVGTLASMAGPCSNVSVEEELATPLANIEIYPNPVQDLVHIEKADNEEVELKLMDVMGRNILSHSLKDNVFSMDLSHYESGVYFITITSEKDQLTQMIVLK